MVAPGTSHPWAMSATKVQLKHDRARAEFERTPSIISRSFLRLLRARNSSPKLPSNFLA